MMRWSGFFRPRGETDTVPKMQVSIALALLGSVVALNVASAFATLVMLPRSGAARPVGRSCEVGRVRHLRAGIGRPHPCFRRALQ